jgi:hypothetical protein
VNFAEHDKSFGGRSLTLGFQWGLTLSLTKGSPPGCVDLVKGFNRGCRLGFRGDDPGLTNFGRFGLADSAISANDAT